MISRPERSALDELARLGVLAEIDEFGNRLRVADRAAVLPGETLKIDRSFIGTMHE